MEEMQDEKNGMIYLGQIGSDSAAWVIVDPLSLRSIGKGKDVEEAIEGMGSQVLKKGRDYVVGFRSWSGCGPYNVWGKLEDNRLVSIFIDLDLPDQGPVSD